MKNALIVVLIIQISFSAAAAEKITLIRAEGTSNIEFEQFVEVNPAYRSYSDALAQERLSSPARAELLNDFETAQRDFLGNSLSKSRRSYEAVAAKALEQSWPDSDRKVIHSAFLRLAQISPSEENKWLTRAANFAPDMKADPAIFSPPLVKRFELARKAAREAGASWRPRPGDSVQAVLLDGRVYRMPVNSAIKVTPGIHRLEIWSNSQAPEVRQLTREQLLKFEFSQRPILNGTCDQPVLASQIPANTRLYFGIDCILVSNETGWENSRRDRTDGPSAPVALALPAMPDFQNEKSSPWKWWAIAGLTLAAGFLVYEHNRPKEDPRVEPTHESGIKK